MQSLDVVTFYAGGGFSSFFLNKLVALQSFGEQSAMHFVEIILTDKLCLLSYEI